MSVVFNLQLCLSYVPRALNSSSRSRSSVKSASITPETRYVIQRDYSPSRSSGLRQSLTYLKGGWVQNDTLFRPLFFSHGELPSRFFHNHLRGSNPCVHPYLRNATPALHLEGKGYRCSTHTHMYANESFPSTVELILTHGIIQVVYQSVTPLATDTFNVSEICSGRGRAHSVIQTTLTGRVM